MPSEVERHKRIQEELCTISIHIPVFYLQLPTHLSMYSLNSAHTIWVSALAPQSLLLPSACLMTTAPSGAQAKYPAATLTSSSPLMASSPLLNAGPRHHHLPPHQSTATSDLPASPNSNKIVTQCVLVFLDPYSAPHSPCTSHSGFCPRPWHAKHVLLIHERFQYFLIQGWSWSSSSSFFLFATFSFFVDSCGYVDKSWY